MSSGSGRRVRQPGGRGGIGYGTGLMPVDRSRNGRGPPGNIRSAATSMPPCGTAGPAIQPAASRDEPGGRVVARPVPASGPSAIVSLHLALVCAALAVDAALGYPDWLFRAIGHPVSWMGRLISSLDERLNRPAWSEERRRAAGAGALAILLAATVAPAALAQWAALAYLPRQAALAVLAAAASTLIAQRSLWTHVIAVGEGFRADGLAGGRRAVGRIVGRNTRALDVSGVVRAAIESLAENFSDGVVAPALWCAAFGLPGIVFYKAVNTADSMIGHLTEKHAAFGRAAAKLDDLVNLPASRLAALWLGVAAIVRRRNWRGAWRAVSRDARHHRSPNAGWPEAAVAGALGLRLAGPRVYGETLVADAWMGDGRADATLDDLAAALGLYRVACMTQGVVLLAALLIARG